MRFHTNASAIERMEQILMNCGAVSISFSDAADEPILEPPIGDHPIWSSLIVQVHFTEQEAYALAAKALQHETEIHSHIELAQISEHGWQEKFQQQFSPMQFGDLWIYPSWQDNPACGGPSVQLDPGLAFGTGQHATTHLCLAALSNMQLSGKHVIDYGCGSGILALAAQQLGAQHVHAVDIDPQAIMASKDNVRRNHLSMQAFTIGAPEILNDLKAELLVANILAAPLLTLRETFMRHLTADSSLLLSGILCAQSDTVAQHYSQYFNCLDVTNRDGWSALTLTLK